MWLQFLACSSWSFKGITTSHCPFLHWKSNFEIRFRVFLSGLMCFFLLNFCRHVGHWEIVSTRHASLTGLHRRLKPNKLGFGSEILYYPFDSIPHILGSRPSNIQLKAKVGPPRDSQKKEFNKNGDFSKMFWIFFAYRLIDLLCHIAALVGLVEAFSRNFASIKENALLWLAATSLRGYEAQDVD